MFPPVNEQSCLSCRYFWPDQHDLGQCHRHPPQIGPRGGQWPAVAGDDWCGEWVGREVQHKPSGLPPMQFHRRNPFVSDLQQQINDQLGLDCYGPGTNPPPREP